MVYFWKNLRAFTKGCELSIENPYWQRIYDDGSELPQVPVPILPNK
jgi:hypothetical protein